MKCLHHYMQESIRWDSGYSWRRRKDSTSGKQNVTVDFLGTIGINNPIVMVMGGDGLKVGITTATTDWFKVCRQKDARPDVMTKECVSARKSDRTGSDREAGENSRNSSNHEKRFCLLNLWQCQLMKNSLFFYCF